MTIGQKIAALRRDANLSQEALADRLSISRQAVSKWEADLAAPSRDKLIELAEVFSISTDELLRPDNMGRVDELPTEQATEGIKGGKVQLPLWLQVWMWVLTAGVILCLCWTGYVHYWVSTTASGTQTIVNVPAQDNIDTASPDLLEYEVKSVFRPDAQDVTQDKWELIIRAVPRAHEAGDVAEFIVRGEETHTAHAEWKDGQYTGTLVVPLEDEYTVSLSVLRGDTTMAMRIEHLYDLKKQSQVAVSAMFTGSVNETPQGRNIAGQVLVTEERQEPWFADKSGVCLTSASVTLYDRGKAVKTVQCQFDAIADGMIGRSAAASFADIVSGKDAEETYFKVDATDNYGRKYQVRAELPEEMQVYQ